jgi:hypothetical protein
MSLGPIELLVVKFPGNQFSGEIAGALQELVEKGIIRVIDIVFLKKGEAGNLTVMEVNDLDDDNFAAFDSIVEEVASLLTEGDIQTLAAALENNSSAGLMLFEHTWATRFRDVVVNANGQLVLNERIPRQVIEDVLAMQAA